MDAWKKIKLIRNERIGIDKVVCIPISLILP